MKQNPLTQSKKIRETYLRVKGEKFTRSTKTGHYVHQRLEVDQSVMCWLFEQGWIEVEFMQPPKTFCNTYIVL